MALLLFNELLQAIVIIRETISALKGIIGEALLAIIRQAVIHPTATTILTAIGCGYILLRSKGFLISGLLRLARLFFRLSEIV